MSNIDLEILENSYLPHIGHLSVKSYCLWRYFPTQMNIDFTIFKTLYLFIVVVPIFGNILPQISTGNAKY